MWNEPSTETLGRIPELYSTEATKWQEKYIYEHFFIFDSDWFIAEYCPRDRLFFGYAILNGDLQNSEWGYAAFDELRAVKHLGVEIDRDLYWKVRKASEVEKIVLGHRDRA